MKWFLKAKGLCRKKIKCLGFLEPILEGFSVWIMDAESKDHSQTGSLTSSDFQPIFSSLKGEVSQVLKEALETIHHLMSEN